jgi:peptide-methionine (S)-S-oxide reductase
MSDEPTKSSAIQPNGTADKEVATLGGGCFWCLEAVFDELKGVEDVISGYAGGTIVRPSYEQVCGGRTGHAEVAQVTFDPKVTSFKELLDVYFTIHDPTTPNRQGHDVGPQYRSIILYHDPEQKRIAEETIADVDASGLWPGKVVTEVEPVGPFWEAEPEHQDYLQRYPDGYTCHFPRPGWRLPARAQG